MKREDLTPRQEEVVLSTDRLLLVTGGPGSGKTATALWAGREALTRGDLEADQRVLYLTFSRSAVSQISRRAPDVMRDARGRIEVSTFHGLSFRLVRAFGRYSGLGAATPRVQSESQFKLFGAEPGTVRYADLVPTAVNLLRSPWVGNLARHRWPLVICDEAQDTGDDQWQLLRELHGTGRLILLADPDQMIHDFRDDVRPERIEDARHIARTVELEEDSHRDASGTIPGVARAVLRRDFDSASLYEAMAHGALRVVPDIEERAIATTVAAEVRQLRRSGCASVGIFGFTNQGAARLSQQLGSLGVGNTIVGISEAQGEALGAIAVLLAHAVGDASDAEVRAALATFIVSFSRGAPSELATALAGRGDVPAQLEELLRGVSAELHQAGARSMADLMSAVSGAWPSVFRASTGSRLWARGAGVAAGLAGGVMGLPVTTERVRSVVDQVQRAREASLASEVEDAHGVPVQVMNFHQTKGREADGVVLVFRHDDFYAGWRDREPFPPRSRLLYVAVSRARRKVTVILPPQPHALIAPFARLVRVDAA